MYFILIIVDICFYEPVTMRFTIEIELDLTLDKDLSIYSPLNIPHIHQCMNEWCWAAAGTMFYNFHKTAEQQEISLFDFIRFEKPTMYQNACTGINAGYNKPILPEKLFEVLNNNTITTLHIPSTTAMDVQKALESKPIIFGVGYTNSPGDGHFIVLSGYDFNEEVLYVNNPYLKAVKTMSWEEFCDSKFTTGKKDAIWSYTGFQTN